MKKVAKGKMTKMSASAAKKADMKSMSPQDKFKAMIAAKKAGKSEKGGKNTKQKMSYGKNKKK